MTARYRLLDLTAMTPEAQDEQLPVQLTQVSCRNRSEPRRRRWSCRGICGSACLPPVTWTPTTPPGVDRDMLVAARRAHVEQPARPVWDMLADPSRLTHLVSAKTSGTQRARKI